MKRKMTTGKRIVSVLLSMALLMSTAILNTPTSVFATEAGDSADVDTLCDNADNEFANYNQYVTKHDDGLYYLNDTSKAIVFGGGYESWPSESKLETVTLNFKASMKGANDRYMLFIYDYTDENNWSALTLRETGDATDFRYGFVTNTEGSFFNSTGAGTRTNPATEDLSNKTALGISTGCTMVVDYETEGKISFSITNNSTPTTSVTLTNDYVQSAESQKFYLYFVQSASDVAFTSIEAAFASSDEGTLDDVTTANTLQSDVTNEFKHFTAISMNTDNSAGELATNSNRKPFSADSQETALNSDKALKSVEFQFSADIGSDSKKFMRLIYDYTDDNNYQALQIRQSSGGILYLRFTTMKSGTLATPSNLQVIDNSASIKNNSWFGTGESEVPDVSVGIASGATVRVEYLSNSRIKFTITSVDDPTKYFTATLLAASESTAQFDDFYLYFSDGAKDVKFKYITMSWADADAPTETSVVKVAEKANEFSYFDSSSIGSFGRMKATNAPFTYSIENWESKPAIIEMKLSANLITNDNAKTIHFIFDYSSASTYKALEVRETASENLYLGFEQITDGTSIGSNDDKLTATGGVSTRNGCSKDTNVNVSFADGAIVKIEYLNESQVRFTFTDCQDSSNTFTTTVTTTEEGGFSNPAFYLLLDANIYGVEFDWIAIECPSAQSQFKFTYADMLAGDPNMMVPYDLTDVKNMLEEFEELKNDSVFSEDDLKALSVVVGKWNTVYETWTATSDGNSDAKNYADAYKKLWSERISTDTAKAWNVYQRLEQDVKEELEEEYNSLVTAFAESATGEEETTIKIACLGDSITVGACSKADEGAADASNYYYPNQLASMLNADSTLSNEYTVDIFGYAGMKVKNDWSTEDLTLEFESHAGWQTSHDGTYDIIIIQLGTNDLSSVHSNQTVDGAKTELYKAAFEKLVMSYLQCENSPYIVISNTPVSYSAKNKGFDIDAVAKINMEIADKYGLPCVDMQSYTLNYMSEYTGGEYDTLDEFKASEDYAKNDYANDNLHFTNSGYQKMAAVFYQAVSSFAIEFNTAEVMGFGFEESNVNSFLTPELYSATIKNTSETTSQDLGFTTNIPTARRTGQEIVEYGVIFSRYANASKDSILSAMTLENADDTSNTSVFKASRSVTGGEEIGTAYTMGVKHIETLGRAYVARSYVKYSDGSVYYSINTRDGLDNSYTNRVGVLNGYAVRSVISVAKSMIVSLANNNTDVSNIGTVTNGEIAWKDGMMSNSVMTEDGLKSIFGLIYENKAVLENLSVSSDQND